MDLGTFKIVSFEISLYATAVPVSKIDIIKMVFGEHFENMKFPNF